MTTVAQGINKQTTIGIQTALGTPNVTSGQILRRKSSVFAAARDMFESDEIVSHHQSTGAAYGLKKVSGKIDGLMSAGTWQLPIEGLLEAVFAIGGTITAATIAAAPGVAPIATFTDSANGFLTAGLKAGDIVRASGFTGAATNSNARNFLIYSLTAGVMTGVFLDGTTVQVADAAGEAVTIAVQGKKCKPPLTGHLNSYYTFEEWYSDILKSELFTDCKIGQLSIGLPATGNATLSVDAVGLGRTLASGAKAVAAHVAETTTGIMAAINGAVYVNGAVAGNITGAQITITNGAAGMGAVVGSNSSPDVSKGRIKVSGSFTGLFDSSTFTALYDAETAISLILAMTADQTATSNAMSFSIGKLKITGDTPDDGEKGIVRSYPFTAELNGAGGAALAWDETIITIQDTAAV